MKKLLTLIALITLPITAKAVHNEYTIEQIDDRCSKTANFIQRVAEERDKGTDIYMLSTALKAYWDRAGVSQEAQAHVLLMVKIVYQHTKMKPDELAFSAKSHCVDELLQLKGKHGDKL